MATRLGCLLNRCHEGRIDREAVNLFVCILTAGNHGVTLRFVVRLTLGNKLKEKHFEADIGIRSCF